MVNYLKLSPVDTVVTLLESVERGVAIEIDGVHYSFDRQLNLGDKLALIDHQLGEAIVKYGVSIGSASQCIKKGEWVHLHNLRSNYMMSTTND